VSEPEISRIVDAALKPCNWWRRHDWEYVHEVSAHGRVCLRCNRVEVLVSDGCDSSFYLEKSLADKFAMEAIDRQARARGLFKP
jgi:hypothetical protein